MLFDYYGIDATVVAGTASPQKQGGFAPFGNEIGALNMAFPQGQCNVQNTCAGTTSQVGWVNADADWDHNRNAPLVAQIGGMWKSTLERGGNVWYVLTICWSFRLFTNLSCVDAQDHGRRNGRFYSRRRRMGTRQFLGIESQKDSQRPAQQLEH